VAKKNRDDFTEKTKLQIAKRAGSLEDTDWGAIVSLYDALETQRPSPVVALNRAIAIGERDGPQGGLAALSAIAGADRLADYPFYFAALGEFELRLGRRDEARMHFRGALSVARNAAERRHFERRIGACAFAKAV
jgi:predicted RNA polymerase sigma factor